MPNTTVPGEANAQERARRDTISEKAQAAFWAVVAAARPDCRSGDLGPLETRFFAGVCSRIIDEWIAANSLDLGWGFLLDEFQDKLALHAFVTNTGGGIMAIRIDLRDGWYALLTDPDGDLDEFRPDATYTSWSLGFYQDAGDTTGWPLSMACLPLDGLVDELAPLLRRMTA